MEHCGVVDRKELKNALSCCGGPIDHLLEVIELTYTEIILGAEGEYRDSCTGTFPVSSAELHLEVSLDNEFVSLRGNGKPSVVTVLPCYWSKGFLVGNEKLV